MTIEERNRMVIENQNIVHSRIQKLYPNVKLEEDLYQDLYQVGIIGMIEGLDRFNFKKKDAFYSYVSSWIDAEIRKFYRENRTFYIPSETYYKAVKYKHYSEEERLEDNKIKELLQLSDLSLKNCKNASKKLTTESTYGQNTKDFRLHINPERVVLKNELCQLLNDVIKDFSKEDRTLIVKYYGLGWNMSKIGKSQSETRQNVKRRRDRILRDFRRSKKLMEAY